jgi:hypothetical protein
MVSSKQFLQQLQAGKIGEALAVAMSETLELDVTTRLANERGASPMEAGGATHPGEFLRTKINFLTGEVHNEVSKELAMSGNYLQLQQFHIEQMNASHRIVQSHFQQIQELLKSWQESDRIVSRDRGSVPVDVPRSTDIFIDEIESKGFSLAIDDVDELIAKDDDTQLDFVSITEPESWLIPDDLHPPSSVEDRTISDIKNDSYALNLAASVNKLESVDEEKSLTQIDELEEVNVYLDRDDEEWGEWIENDDIGQEPVINYSPANNERAAAIPDWEEHWLQEHTIAIPEPKPPISRIPIARHDVSDSLEKFAPEYVGLSVTTQPDRSEDLSHPIWRKNTEDITSIEDLLSDR